ncbi:MAG: dTDP-glucose 4,6-dehydratase [Wenzhouxiangellaceae bacterium]
MNTCLVTGGAGFIGSHFVRASLQQHCQQVINLDKLTYAACPATVSELAALPGYQLAHGDIQDPALVRRVLAESQPRWVVNFAAESHVDRSIEAPDAFVRTNVLGTQTLLDACLEYWRGLPDEAAKAFRLLHISTDEVYGSLGDQGAFTEESPFRPNSPYAASKAASDHLARAYHHTYGLPVLISHCSNNYGSYQFPEKLIPLMILKAWAGEELPIYGDGAQVRDWLHVSDHVSALWTMLSAAEPGSEYVIGGDCEWTNKAVVQKICELLDQRQALPQGPRAALMRSVADRPGHDRRYAIDASRLRHDLGWRPQTDFAAGLAATIDWYLNAGAWLQAARDSGYQGQRLGQGRRQA